MEFTSSPSPLRDRPPIAPKPTRLDPSSQPPRDSNAARQQRADAAAQTNAKEAKISKKRLAAVLLIIIVLIGVALWLAINAFTGISEEHSAKVSSTPQFTSLTPNKTSIQELGGWEHSTTPSGEQVYSFEDVIDTVKIKVTQQNLPQSESVDEIAKGFNATKTLPTKDVKTYIGTSTKGPQSVITAKGDALLLIMSESSIPDSSWVRYVESLEATSSAL